jgi:hypothetical protein
MNCSDKFLVPWLVAGLLGGFGSLAQAELVWAATTAKTKLLPGGSFTAEFLYENRGKEPVQILGVESDCGCVTVLESPGKTILPGGKGRLEAKMELEGRIGQQMKRIWVRTNDQPTPGYELALEVEVLEVFAFDPKELEMEWKQAGEGDAQVLTIRRIEKVPAEIRAVESTSKNFDAILDSSRAEEGIWQVRVAPTSTREDNEGVIFIRSDYPEEHHRTYLLLGRILRK